jgi:hypothetical protein
MSCFYCAREQVNSGDAGACKYCRKDVCTEGLTSQPPRHHGDTCACGCADLVCIYHMERHARTDHRSTFETCFANTALQVSLLAAASIEDLAGARSGSKRMEGALRNIREYVVVAKPIRSTTIGRQGSVVTRALQFAPEKTGLHYALASVVPPVMNSLQASWKRIPERKRARFTGALPQRLDEIAGMQVNLLQSPLTDDAFKSYGALSPRLQRLMQTSAVQNVARSSGKGLYVDAGIARSLQRVGRNTEIQTYLKSF